MATVPKRVYECARQIIPQSDVVQLGQLFFGVGLRSTDELLAVPAATREAFVGEVRTRALSARVPLDPMVLEVASQNLFRVRCRIMSGVDLRGSVPPPPVRRNPALVSLQRRASRCLPPSRVPVCARRPAVGYRPVLGPSRLSAQRVPSAVGRRSVRPHPFASCVRRACGARPACPVVTPVNHVPRSCGTGAVARPRYIPRRLFLAGVRPAAPAPVVVTTEEGLSGGLDIVFSPPPTATTDIWQAALLFYNAPGFFAEAMGAGIPTDELELCFRNAIERRCGTVNTRRKVAGFVSAFVAFAAGLQRKFYGKLALFAVVPFLTSLAHRGRSVPPLARWALKVFDEALSLELPLSHPAVLNAVRKGDMGPKQPKQAPMLPLELLRAIDDACRDESRPYGLRLYSALFMVMTMASLRFGDTKVVFFVWVSETALCGHSRDLKKKGRPIFTWAAPLAGVQGMSCWARIVEQFWFSNPPLKGGYRALFPLVDTEWKVKNDQAASYHVVLRMFRCLCTTLGFKDPKWTLHSPRAFFPTCANQLGWSEEDRRKIGHWAPGSVMMEHYDRAVCTTELRLRDDILRRVRTQNWVPTGSFEVPNASPDIAVGGPQIDGPAVDPPFCDTEPAKPRSGAREVVPPGLAGCDPSFEATQSDDETSLGTDAEDADFSEVDISDLYAPSEFA